MELKIRDKRKEMLEIIRRKISAGGSVYIYGASTTGQMVRDYLSENGIEAQMRYVIDDKYYADGDLKKIPFSEFEKNKKPEDILICGFASYKRYCELAGEVEKYDGVDFFFFPFPYSMNTERCYIDEAYFKEYRSGFERTYERLADERSKEILRMFLEAQIGGTLKELQDHVSEKQYFDISIPKDLDIFIDGGAYIGDTMEAAFSYFDSIKDYYLFEPDPEHQENIKSVIERIGDRNIHWIKKGLWNEETVLHFSSDDSASRFDDTGDIEVEVTSVDKCVKAEKGQKIYFKMDIEGSEAQALRGASDLIRRCKPYMAICVYHKREDLIVIPDLVDSISENSYKYYLKYYGDNFRELVLYCIPKERI